MKTLAVLCQKGGSAKTTTATNLAVEATRRGLVTVIIDIDPQVSACKWRDLRSAEEPTVVHTAVPYLERSITSAREAGADLAIIDAAGRMDEALYAAASVADMCLVAIQPSAADLFTVDATLRTIRNAGCKMVAAVLTRVRGQGSRETQTRELLANLKLPVCGAVLGERLVYQDAFATGLGVVEAEPSSKAAQEIRDLFDEIDAVLKIKVKVEKKHVRKDKALVG